MKSKQTLKRHQETEEALRELEELLDRRIEEARNGGIRNKTVSEIFEEALHRRGTDEEPPGDSPNRPFPDR